jgi:hypothetical protein
MAEIEQLATRVEHSVSLREQPQPAFSEEQLNQWMCRPLVDITSTNTCLFACITQSHFWELSTMVVVAFPQPTSPVVVGLFANNSGLSLPHFLRQSMETLSAHTQFGLWQLTVITKMVPWTLMTDEQVLKIAPKVMIADGLSSFGTQEMRYMLACGFLNVRIARDRMMTQDGSAKLELAADMKKLQHVEDRFVWDSAGNSVGCLGDCLGWVLFYHRCQVNGSIDAEMT